MNVALLLGAFALGALACYFVTNGPILFKDRGSRIYATPSKQARDAVVSVLSQSGLRGRFRIDSNSVSRAVMSDYVTIISYTDSELWATMGRPAAGLAVTVHNPTKAATRAVGILERAGFAAKYLGELDKDVPAGTMVFVSTSALAGSVLIFRRHFFKMGSKPPAWK